MSSAPGETVLPSYSVPSVIVLGADCVLAALPATPVQLAHACVHAGYQHVVPASWGDELIASAVLHELRAHERAPAIQCSCPMVANRLLAAGNDLRPFLISLVAPPAALARYLRVAYAPQKLRITYAGRCPGAVDDAIDARVAPEELLSIFVDRKVVVQDQPRVFDSVIPLDRRRFRSLPGGVPSTETLWSESGGRTLVEMGDGELSVDLVQQLLSEMPVLIDAAAKLGCLCSGAVDRGASRAGRADIVALEPPRARTPIVDDRWPISLGLPLPPSHSVVVVPSPAEPSSLVPGGKQPAASLVRAESGAGAHVAVIGLPERQSIVRTTPPADLPLSPRRRSPTNGTPRPVLGGTPTARDVDGRLLPRAYVARRRSPPRGIRGHSEHAVADRPITGPRSRARADLVDRLPVTRTTHPVPKDAPGSVAAANAKPSTRQLALIALVVSLIVTISVAIGVAAGRLLTNPSPPPPAASTR